MVDVDNLWYYDDEGNMICNSCGSEVWYLENGYICSGKRMCFNENEEDIKDVHS